MLKKSDDLGLHQQIDESTITFDSRMTFEKRLRSLSRATSERLGIMRKSSRVFHDRSLLGRCFRSFDLLVLEYCSAV